MKSNICPLTGSQSQLKAVLEETEKCAVYNGLDAQSTLRVRLLAEELVSMLPELLEHTRGEYWIENDGSDYELHVSVKADEITLVDREKLLAVSSTGKNAAAVGVMGKIRAAVEIMLFPVGDIGVYEDFYNIGLENSATYSSMWSMKTYAAQIKLQNEANRTDAWDELEKSIIASLADDVVVGVKGRKADIIVKKHFA